MRPYTYADIPRLTDIATKAASGASVLVWWDVANGEFLVLRSDATAARILLDRCDADPQHALVGIFDFRGDLFPERVSEALRAELMAHCPAVAEAA